MRDRFPDNPEGVIRTGLSLLAAGRLTEADAALERAVTEYPENVEALTEYAWVAQLERRWPVALARWERVITRHPELPLPRRFGAEALMELGRYREASAVLAPALRLIPDDVDLCVMQAWIVTRSRGELAATEWARLPEQRKRWSLAITRWKMVLQRFPADPESLVGLGNALMLDNRLSEAEAVLESGALQFPDAVQIAAAAARVTTRRADWPRALMTWKRVKTRFPDTAIGYAGYGRTLRESGDLVGAAHQLRQSCKRVAEAPGMISSG